MSERHPEDEPINWRRTDDGVAVYDETNPDAWIRVALEAGVPAWRGLLAICPRCGAVLASPGPPGNGTVCGDCGAAYDHARRDPAGGRDDGTPKEPVDGGDRRE